MKPLVAWFARNPVAANLLMFFLVAGGAMSVFMKMKIELFPEFSLDMVSVSVAYPGAAPEEVEEAICVRIEEEVHSIEGVKKVTSTAVEGMGTVQVEIEPGEDARRVLDDVKTRVDAIQAFPELAERPVIQEMLMRNQVINVAVYGEAGERTLKRLAEEVRDEINALSGISQVQLAAVRADEVSIEVTEEALQRHGLSFDQVAAAVRRSSLNLSGGSVRTEGGEVLLRTQGQAYRGEEFEEAVVVTRPDGSRILVGDVARVVDGFADTDQSARFNGRPAAIVQVFRVGDESALAVSATVHEYVEGKRHELPDGISLDTWQDASVYLQGRLNLLLENGLQGGLLVFLVLALFLRFRLAFWVTIGIPLSFMGALLVMPAMGQSLNLLSMFAFILVLGIVVDDAIVVGESVFKEIESGNGGIKGAIAGVQSVAVPVVFAVLTTIVAFLPMTALPGVMGKFFKVIPLAVIPALVFSLVESQLILPAHLTHEGGFFARLSKAPPFSWWVRFQGLFSNGLIKFSERVYQPVLKLALHHRYTTLAAALASLAVAVGIVGGGFVQFVFFPPIEGEIVAATLTMPQGTSAASTASAVARIEQAAQDVIADLEDEGHPVVRNFLASIGEQPITRQKASNGGNGGQFDGAHLAEVVLELIPAEERSLTASQVADRWRAACGAIPGAVELSFDGSMMSAGKPLDIELSGDDMDEVRDAARDVRLALNEFDGVLDVTDSYRGGKQELALDIRPSAEALGLSRLDLARQVRQGFYGEEAQRIQRGREEVKVMVRYPLADRRTLHGLESMRVRTASGDGVPFPSVAEAETRRGFATIQRTDRQRTVRVTGDVDATVANANQILDEMERTRLPEILARHPGVDFAFGGQRSDQTETVGAMLAYYALALLGIFGLMAIPFRSYLQPLIVMTAIPFGFVGAILGHLIMGHDLSMLSVLGIAALAGVVVNDSLVLVDFVNRKREEGLSIADAARAAGMARFRPILLTSLTTFVGLLPLMFERSAQAQFLIPMAISLAFGVLYSTLVSLFLVPAGYLVLGDVKRAARWIFGIEGDASRAGAASAEA